MIKQIRWPKWLEEYEDYAQSNEIARKHTMADRAWHWAYAARDHLISTIRLVARKALK